MRTVSAVAWAAILFLLAPAANASSEDTLKPAGTIKLAGMRGDLGPMAADGNGRHLYVLGDDIVAVIDTRTGKETGQIRSLGGLRGVAFLPDLRLLIVAHRGARRISIFNDNLYLLGSVDAVNPTYIRYDPEAELVYVGHGCGAMAVIDPLAIKKVGEINLNAKAGDMIIAGRPDSFQLEAKGPRIFVNVSDRLKIVVVDRQKRAVVAEWPLKGPIRNYSMALDEPNHRLFVGCNKPPTLLVLDTETGNTVASVECCRTTVSDVFYDAERKRIYVSGDGCISIFEQVNADSYKSLGEIRTGELRNPLLNARSRSLFVPSTRKLYVTISWTKTEDAQLRVFDCGPGK